MTAAVIVLGATVALLAAILVLTTSEDRRRTTELVALVDRLCQRIQAPAAAVLEHDEQVRAVHGEEYAPPAVEPDDDEAYWLSRDKLAEALMRDEVSG